MLGTQGPRNSRSMSQIRLETHCRLCDWLRLTKLALPDRAAFSARGQEARLLKNWLLMSNMLYPQRPLITDQEWHLLIERILCHHRVKHSWI